jgi:hypothetical protein
MYSTTQQTAVDFAAYLGKQATVQVGGLTVQVIIANVKQSYGRTRFLVSPVAGSGSIWIESVTLTQEGN